MNGPSPSPPGDHKGTQPIHPTALAPTECWIEAYWTSARDVPSFPGVHEEVIIATLQQDLNTLMADVATIKQLLQQRDQTS